MTSVDSSTSVTLVLYFSSISPQSLRLLPHLRRWQQLYDPAGLSLSLVHSPQFSFEASATYHEQLPSLLALSPQLSIQESQEADDQQLWPRLQLIAPDGTIIKTTVGADDCALMEEAIRSALIYSGYNQLPPITESNEHVHRLGSQCFPAQPDAYTGLRRAHYKNSHPVRSGITQCIDPLDLANFGLSLQGQWDATDGSVKNTVQTTNGDYISFVFSGFEVSAVLEPLNHQPAIVTITINGQPLTSELAGSDVTVSNGLSTVKVTQPRLHQLLRSDHYFAPADLRLHATDGQFAAYLLSASGCRAE